MTERIVYKDIYLQLKAIFSGCDTLTDAFNFGKIYINRYPQLKTMIISYMNSLNYKDTLDIKTKQNIINDINMCDNRDDALNKLSKLINKTNDDIYHKTLERIAKSKNYKKKERILDYICNISKSCPHCSHTISMPETSKYIICGYHNQNQGYDWFGCGNDWCFGCNKKLCKKWETDNLQLQSNRQHNNKCCLDHSKKNGYNYPADYCQCHIDSPTFFFN